jgi:hypothetical protein
MRIYFPGTAFSKSLRRKRINCNRVVSFKDINSEPTNLQKLLLILPKYKPLKGAAEFHNAKQAHRGLKGGVGAGKTYMLAADDILVSYLNAPNYHISTSPSYDNAYVTVLPTLIELCEKNDLEYEWTISKNLFRIILFKGNQCGVGLNE